MKPLSGHTIPFAVLGHPIGHTLSPVMHNASIEKLGLDAIYLAFDVPPENLMEVLPAMRTMGFRGVNLTVPLKEVAFRGIDDLAGSAVVAGAVNTVEFKEDGGLRGHSTDGVGFLTAFDEAFGTTVEGAGVFVLGTGGAGRTVAITCAQAGCSSLTLSDIDEKRSEAVRNEISRLAPSCKVALCGPGAHEAALESDVVIQATPVGMKTDDEPLLKSNAFREGQFVYDLIYMYPETGLMKEARSAGAKCANGLSMLLHQGAASFKIWTGTDPDIEAMRTALMDSVYGNN